MELFNLNLVDTNRNDDQVADSRACQGLRAEIAATRPIPAG